jgi:hypothetical protein
MSLPSDLVDSVDIDQSVTYNSILRLRKMQK